MGVQAPPVLWAFRVLWLTLPFTLGDAFAGSVDGRSDPVRLTASALAWAVWVLALGASLVAAPRALTTTRVLAATAPAGGVAAVAAAGFAAGAWGWAGLAFAVAAAAAAMAAGTGAWFVDGASYGDELRLPLRPPAALLAGPVELAWALTVVPLPAGVLLLAARNWVAGGLLLVAGLLTAWFGFRVLDRLSHRCLVFVPAGMTLVDDLSLAEPQLFPRRSVVRFGPAPADTTALDLTAGAAGLILQVDLDEEIEPVPTAPRGGVVESVSTRSALLAPSRPGKALAAAESRRIHVGRT